MLRMTVGVTGSERDFKEHAAISVTAAELPLSIKRASLRIKPFELSSRALFIRVVIIYEVHLGLDELLEFKGVFFPSDLETQGGISVCESAMKPRARLCNNAPERTFDLIAEELYLDREECLGSPLSQTARDGKMPLLQIS